MSTLRPLAVVFAALLVAAAALPAQAGKGHVHGLATLKVAVDGETLTLTLESPLDNLLGFERAPRDDAERRAVATMAERLRNPEKMLLPAAAARCTLAEVRLTSLVLAGTPAHDAPAGAAGAAAAAKPADGHGDLMAQYRYRCAAPAELRSVEVRFFESFRRLASINAQVAGAKGQSAKRLTPKQSVLKL
ncbi:MAG: DUF2796 domain-containing protein [Burkholderiales bacterium]|nr:DUF2796 domain-containing protein [Burkholderiales bacterium]